MVAELEASLVELRPQIDKKEAETQAMVVDLEVRQKEAAEQEKLTAGEEAKSRALFQKVASIKEECEQELEVAMPLYREALSALETLDKNDIRGFRNNFVRIKGTDQYYDLTSGERVAETEIDRNYAEERMQDDYDRAMAELPKTPELGYAPTMQSTGGMRLNTEGQIENTDETSPFSFAKRLEMSKRMGQFKKSFNPNTGEFKVVEPNMGVSITPNTSGGITVGSMTGMPTGLQEISDGTLTANFKSGTPTLENQKSVQRLIEHRKKYGDPNLGTGY